MNTLILTAHDYRTPRKANMHFIASELAKRGTTRFFSLRYSWLSRWTNDARTFLDADANRTQVVDGVECYLWKQFVHPFNTRRPFLRGLERRWFRRIADHVPVTLERWMCDADIILFESGSAVMHVALARRLNPRARLVYVASDDLDVIGSAWPVKECFAEIAPIMDALCLPSSRLVVPPRTRRYFVPHGIDETIALRADPSPYGPGAHAVSVGSMLFDRTFFEIAGHSCPDLTFHVIGCGLAKPEGFPPNVLFYGEMSHDETLRYIKHADIGIAPYCAETIPPYLVETSMKLMQYAFFGLPAVCPEIAAGGLHYRHGYRPGDVASIAASIAAARTAPAFEPPRFLSWSEVTDRLVDPAAFPDARIA